MASPSHVLLRQAVDTGSISFGPKTNPIRPLSKLHFSQLVNPSPSSMLAKTPSGHLSMPSAFQSQRDTPETATVGAASIISNAAARVGTRQLRTQDSFLKRPCCATAECETTYARSSAFFGFTPSGVSSLSMSNHSGWNSIRRFSRMAILLVSAMIASVMAT